MWRVGLDIDFKCNLVILHKTFAGVHHFLSNTNIIMFINIYIFIMITRVCTPFSIKSLMCDFDQQFGHTFRCFSCKDYTWKDFTFMYNERSSYESYNVHVVVYVLNILRCASGIQVCLWLQQIPHKTKTFCVLHFDTILPEIYVMSVKCKWSLDEFTVQLFKFDYWIIVAEETFSPPPPPVSPVGD